MDTKHSVYSGNVGKVQFTFGLNSKGKWEATYKCDEGFLLSEGEVVASEVALASGAGAIRSVCLREARALAEEFDL